MKWWLISLLYVFLKLRTKTLRREGKSERAQREFWIHFDVVNKQKEPKKGGCLHLWSMYNLEGTNYSAGVVVSESKVKRAEDQRVFDTHPASPSSWDCHTHNLWDLAAGGSSFEWNWTKMISPHLLRTSALRFLHFNLPFRQCGFWYDYFGNDMLTSALNKAAESSLALAPFDAWASEYKGQQLLTWNVCRSKWLSSTCIRRMIINTWMTEDRLSVTGHYC